MVEQVDRLPEERLSFFHQSALWSALSNEDLEIMTAAMQPMRYANDQVIIRQGEPGSHLHVLISGQAEARVRSHSNVIVPIATFRAGDCFGEMSLLSGDPTSADVVAVEDSLTLMLDRATFNALIAAHPHLLREFVRMISRRLRTTDLAVGAARERTQELTRFLREERSEHHGDLLGKHPLVKDLQRQIDKQARLDSPVLIQGERGTGKELIARLIHFRGPRKDAPLLSTDCAQIAETRWGDSLFGDYHRDEDGPDSKAHSGLCYMDLAEGGTILLKNIEALPPAVHERLVRFLATNDARHHVRVMATCRDRFTIGGGAAFISPDNVIAAPSLRERKKDIPELAIHFIGKHAQRLNKSVKGLDDQAIIRLVSYDYYIANVQELEDAIERAVILTDKEKIEAEEIFLGPPPSPHPGGFNLLKLPQPIVRFVLGALPNAVRVAAALAFTFILYQCFFGTGGENGNIGTMLVWSLWWPTLVLSFFFAGRLWCAICPMAFAGATAQRVKKLELRIPGWVKNYDVWIVLVGFFVIVWAEEVTGMRHSPRATGILLLFILSGAVVASILFPRRTWCRHLCPLGGLASSCSTSSLLELRPTIDICTAKCTGHSCYKGGDGVDGCPMFNHVMFVDSNQQCVLCLDCVRSCPNGSPQVNLRLPGRELWTSLTHRPGVGEFVVMLAGLLVGLSLVQAWEQSPGFMSSLVHNNRIFLITGVLVLSAAVPLLGLWLATRRLNPSSNAVSATRFWQRVAAWVPLVGAGFTGYQVAFVPGLDSLRATLDYQLGGTGYSMSFSVLFVVQFAMLTVGLAITLGALWKNAKTEDADERKHWVKEQLVSWAAAPAYWALLLILMLQPAWLGR